MALPPEAGDQDARPFEPDDEWIRAAEPELQKEAMRRWFCDRFEDPANETPWDGEEKKYVFIWGGPYDPNDQIQERFGHVVDFDVMWELIQELWRDVGDEWAPIEHEGAEEFERYVTRMVVESRDDPLSFFQDRLHQIEEAMPQIAQLQPGGQLMRQLVHSALIAALEAYLADTVLYWVTAEEKVLRKFVGTNTDFQKRQLNVGEEVAPQI